MFIPLSPDFSKNLHVLPPVLTSAHTLHLSSPPVFDYMCRLNIVFSVLISYILDMLFTIYHALSQPYGCDAQDIKLNYLCSQYFWSILRDLEEAKIDVFSSSQPKKTPRMDRVAHRIPRRRRPSDAFCAPLLPFPTFVRLLKSTPASHELHVFRRHVLLHSEVRLRHIDKMFSRE